MAKYKKLITMLLGIFFAYAASANIKQEIASLEKNKQQKTKNQTVPAINHTLPNGKRVNLNDWQLVVFMQSTCQYCREFDPIIKKNRGQSGIKNVCV